MHTHFHAFFRTAGNAQMLDAIAQLFRIAHIILGDFANAFGKGFIKLQINAKGQGCQNGELVGRIYAFHIKGGIGFRIT